MDLFLSLYITITLFIKLGIILFLINENTVKRKSFKYYNLKHVSKLCTSPIAYIRLISNILFINS